MVYVRVDCRYNKDNIIKWIREGWAKEIKMHSADSLYVSATGTNKKRPTEDATSFINKLTIRKAKYN